MAKHLLLVDGNSIGHANHNGTVLTVGGPTGMQVQAIYGFLRSMRALTNRYPGADILVLWDGRAQWRLDIYPAYKGNRESDPTKAAHRAAYKAQTPFIEKSLELLGVKQARSPLLEADDLAKHIVESISASNAAKPPEERTRITLVTGDHDWMQLIRELVDWFSITGENTVTAADFFEKTGYMSTAEFVEGKCLQGDTSDNIPGIENVGEGTAQKFMAQWRNLDRFWAAVDAGTHTPAVRKSKTAKSLHPEQLIASPEGRAMLRMNRQLMDMRNCRKPEQGEMVIKAQAGSKAGFLTLCERLAFASILREQAMFLRSFPNCK